MSTDNAVQAERIVPQSAGEIFDARSAHFEYWFAQDDSIHMTPEVGAPFFFETEMGGRRHAHYGRFLELVPDKLVKMTWMTGDPGTKGAETTVTMQISETADGTHIHVLHEGFYDEETAAGHGDAWPLVLEHMESQLSART